MHQTDSGVIATASKEFILGLVEKSQSQSLAILVIAALLEKGSNQIYRAKMTSSFVSLGGKFSFFDRLWRVFWRIIFCRYFVD